MRAKLPGAIRLAKKRQADNAAKGKPAVAVTVTVDQLLAKLEANNYRCALTGLEFWDDDGGSYGPTSLSIDRIEAKGPYDDENTRVALLGVNSMRGEGSDEDMYRIAAALCRHRSLMGSSRRDADHNRRAATAKAQSELTAPNAASAR